MGPVRDTQTATHFRETYGVDQHGVEREGMLVPCSAEAPGAQKMSVMDDGFDAELLSMPNLSIRHLRDAVATRSAPSIGQDHAQRFDEFTLNLLSAPPSGFEVLWSGELLELEQAHFQVHYPFISSRVLAGRNVLEVVRKRCMHSSFLGMD